MFDFNTVEVTPPAKEPVTLGSVKKKELQIRKSLKKDGRL